MSSADRHRVVRVLTLGVLASCLSVTSWAQPQELRPTQTDEPSASTQFVQASDRPWDGAALVHELLRLDAEAALAAEQGRASIPRIAQVMPDAQIGKGDFHPGSSRDASFIQVHAIYGTGQRLHAELSVGMQRYVYRAGRRLPVGMPFSPDEEVPALERIAGACVALSRRGRTEHYCVNRPSSIAPVQP